MTRLVRAVDLEVVLNLPGVFMSIECYHIAIGLTIIRISVAGDS